jgi:hypothetical protein
MSKPHLKFTGANRENRDGSFVNLCVLRFLLLDLPAEHRFPNNVGPEGLRPTKAWEIHLIKLLASVENSTDFTYPHLIRCYFRTGLTFRLLSSFLFNLIGTFPDLSASVKAGLNQIIS